MYISYIYTAAVATSLQSGPTLSDPTDCSLLGSSVDGIFQARVLEWGAIAFKLFNKCCCDAADAWFHNDNGFPHLGRTDMNRRTDTRR